MSDDEDGPMRRQKNGDADDADDASSDTIDPEPIRDDADLLPEAKTNDLARSEDHVQEEQVHPDQAAEDDNNSDVTEPGSPSSPLPRLES